MAGKKKSVSCDVETTLRIIGGKWKVLVIYFLQDGTKRFNQLHQSLGGISHRTLVKQLRELERDGIVSRKVYLQIPPKVEYSLTKVGHQLKPVLEAMHIWGERFGPRSAKPGS
ncbi:MAG: helix-turn-helix transcriptional regulator [Deltaproteobacteria bacterium]|nr:helix-turn-helix transcriptional regulator [Deltaproteobacteria bacterium]